jgi:FlaA1/EpsC-like NDP-sugar epimerase
MYRMRLLFEKYQFDLVYHAAAYKHVPLIERNPHEAIYVNILGTVNLSILATSYNVDRFVMISTDKAVNPTNVMGASKRAAEIYVQSLQNEKGVATKFITTRFGNVLGSNGSVIPHFEKQISQGGPVTVTHKNIIRYFMTIPEACQLVLQAGTMGNGGEIYVFDMGEPKKILDLAEKMIRLSGFEPYTDIDIKITGLRPGEKLYEELLTESSIVQPTHHSKIMVAKVEIQEFSEIKKKIKTIVKAATKKDDEQVVKLLKDIVPEYKSENSKFKSLD